MISCPLDITTKIQNTEVQNEKKKGADWDYQIGNTISRISNR